MADYIRILRQNINREASAIEPEDYESFMGFAADAEDDSFKEKCIENFIRTLAADQGVDEEDVSFIGVDANDLFDLFGED